MNPQTRAPSAFSKVSVQSQTVIPREVRERLGLKPGDRLRYRVTDDGMLLDKAPANEAATRFVATRRAIPSIVSAIAESSRQSMRRP